MFRIRHVQAILASNLLLQLGIWVRNFAILLYVTDITHNSPVYVSLISVAEYAPIFIFSFIGGTFADRWRPKRTMIGCDLLSALSVFVVLLTLLFGSWQMIFFVTLVSAILSQFSMPSAMKLLKRHVPKEQLQPAMAMFQTLVGIFMVIGPAIGTYVYQSCGIHVSIAVMGAMFLLSALTLSFLPKDEVAEHADGAAAHQSFTHELKEGFRYVFERKILKTLGGTFALAGLSVGLTQPLMVFVAVQNLRMDKSILQWLLMANGVAMLVGGGLVFGLSKKIPAPKLLALGLLVSTVCNVGIGWSTLIPLTFVFQVLNGLFFPCIQTGINTIFLQNTEESFVGRVNGVMLPMFMGMMVAGMSVAGLLMNSLSLLTVYVIGGVLFLAGALLLVQVFHTGSAAPSEQ
ncbi:MFS transporter [Paenibacillus filicis]|uniref:MFS transporter n=1 Tax=Paenibacillus gyeongsangnamensis TaxID=3388067 RepID=A0ABT4QJR7_9BACL|nr:MFS transporter [Paenibacillus filicis]MCZ8517123.1 MFS transporter [Paenibacillus filicis]